MATLIRVLKAGVPIAGTIYGIGDIVNADDNRAKRLIKLLAAESIESFSYDVDETGGANKWGARLALAGAALTLDLNSLGAAGVARAGGVTNFSSVRSIVIRNLGTGSNVIIVGGAAATQFADWLGGATQTIRVYAGGKLVIHAPAGLTTSSKKDLKLDPGADTFAATIAICGTAT